MNTLFWRILVSFWLAMMLILGGAVAVTATVAWYRIATLGNIDPGRMFGSANVALRDEGVPGLKVWLETMVSEHPDIDIYIVDDTDKDILGRTLPEHIQQWLALDARPSRAGEGFVNAHYWPYGYDLSPNGITASNYPSFNRSHLLANPKIIAPDGKALMLLVAWFGATPIDVLGANGITVPLGLIAVAVSLAICWWLARQIARPVAKLQTVARTIASGNLDARVDQQICRRRDELGNLAQDFNQMAMRLQAQISSKETLIRDISHELRSPLTRLRVALGLAQKNDTYSGVQMERMEREIERLDALIGETLQLSRLSGTEATFVREPVELDKVVNDVVDDAHFEASAVGKTIVAATIPGVFTLGSFELLRRAVDNIVRNAIRFTPVGSTIELSLKEDAANAIVTVRDHGPGVPEEDLKRIFEAFYRVADARDRETGGVGLGLAITARIMALGGGSVGARNAADGGLIVELRFPKGAPTAAAVV